MDSAHIIAGIVAIVALIAGAVYAARRWEIGE
jgi:hypothetical protein